MSKQGDKILYQLKGKQFWKRGIVIGHPAEGLIEIEKRESDAFETAMGTGQFTVSLEDVTIKEEKAQT